MKYIALIVFFLMFSSTETPLKNVRNKFPNIVSLDEANAFIENLKNDVSPEAKAYTAAMILMKSRFVKGPFSKLKFFKQGKKILDKDIIENPSIIEIRYIRFLMQKQIPKFLGYNKNIDEDFNLIYANLEHSNLKNSFKIKILNNMLLVDNLSVSEKTKINKILSRI